MRLPTLAVAAMAAFALGAAQAAAQDWPGKPIRFVVPFIAGGSTDVLTRLLCDQLAVELKTPCIVENKSGAGGNVGGQAVAASAPDGYTFLVSAPGVLAYNKILYREMAFDPDKDLDAICLYAFQANVLVVHPALPVRSVGELIAYAKANPRKLNYASGGVGSTSHVAGELFRTMASLEWQHVPYRGTGASLVDLLAGQVQLTIDNLPAILPHIKTGGLRALAVSTDKRVPQLPDLPTIAELGVPGYEGVLWMGLMVPAGTPQPVIATLAAAAQQAVRAPDLRDRFSAEGIDPVGGTPEEFAAVIKRELPQWRDLVRDAKITVD